MRAVYCRSLAVAMALLAAACIHGQELKVLHPSGADHGFLVVRSVAGAILASGELTQSIYRDGIKTHVVFHFRDGSLDDETMVYTQHRTFHLVTDRHIQRGPTFSHPSETLVDTGSHEVTVRDLSKHKNAVTTEHMDLPPELANGVLFTEIQNLQPNTPVEVPYVAFSPKPRMVKLAIAQDGEDRYKVAGRSYPAIKYVIKVRLGGVAGVVAPMIGKQPPDYQVWVSKSSVPAILRIDGAFFSDGPIWSVRLASPVW